MRGALIFVTCLALTAGIAAPAEATFPGENGKLVLTQFTGILAVATVNPDGTALTPLTEEPTSFGAAWSSDGRQIAFLRHVGPRSHIYVMNEDGTDVQLVHDTDDVILSLTWAPGGDAIAFSSYVCSDTSCGGPVDIWKLDLGTGEASKLFEAPGPFGLAQDPDWSPDGQSLAFTLYRFEQVCDDSDPEIADCFFIHLPAVYRMDADGTNLVLVAANGARPSWSPDGRRIAFDLSRRVYTVAAEGGDPVQLAPGESPFWSPDGTMIASGLDSDVFVMSADGSNRTKILDGVGTFGGSPAYGATDWQPIPNAPPDCSGVRADPDVLWPPNHKLRTVTLSGASDPDGDPVTLRIDGSGDDSIELRAERGPRGTSRTYVVAFTATDERGASCAGTATVTVPGPKN